MQNISNNKMIVAGVATAALVGYGLYTMMGSKGDEECHHQMNMIFKDKNFAEKKFLYKTEAFKRSGDVSRVSYKIGYALLKGGKQYHGRVEIKFSLSRVPDDLFVDYHGDSVTGLCINGKDVNEGEPFRDHRIYFDQKYLQKGENIVHIGFVSNFVKDCQGMHYF